MDTSPAAVRERAEVEQYEPPVFGIEEPLWVATDEECGCSGVGRVRAEAVGNLIALVVAHDEAAYAEAEYVKFPGKAMEKTWTGESRGVVGRFLERF